MSEDKQCSSCTLYSWDGPGSEEPGKCGHPDISGYYHSFLPHGFKFYPPPTFGCILHWTGAEKDAPKLSVA